MIDALLSKLQREDIFACAQCGYCVNWCPIYDRSGWESASPRGKVFLLKKMLESNGTSLFSSNPRMTSEFVQRLFDCTTCGRCTEKCHLELDLLDLWFRLRELAVRQGVAPQSVGLMEKTLLASRNVFGMDSQSRTDWATYTGAEVKVQEKADIVYFVGCVTSYSGRSQGIAQSIAAILNHVGESWSLMHEEWCCGHPLAVSGATGRYREIAEHNVREIESMHAKVLVSGCPGCCLALREEYPRILERELNFKVVHFAQLLDQYVAEGKLRIPELQAATTYHDPCELARLGGVVDEPRRVLRSFVKRLVEPEESGTIGRCCGSGGLLKATNNAMSGELAQKRSTMLQRTGADIITSACPSCDQNLAEALSKVQDSKRVQDLAELVAQQIGLV
jgi:heterodisulfide reductase subunit D